MNHKDYYQTLGVSKNAKPEEIKKAYRRLAKRFHPDANPGDKNAENKFKEISEAHDILSDPQKRKQYDQMKEMGSRGFEGFGSGGSSRRQSREQKFNFEDLGGMGDFGDIFSSFFDLGGRARQERWGPQKGEDIYSEIEIPFEQSIAGGKVLVNLKKEETCPTCEGSGAKPGSKSQICPECGGSGMLSFSQGGFAVQRPCPRCYGKGNIISEFCPDCGGSGQILADRKIAINIPPGIENDSNLRLKGQGNPGISGGAPGDLIVKIKISEHKFFTRKGNDIYCQIPINLAQAILGSKIRIKTIDGKVDLKIPAGTQTGTKFKLKGRGVEAGGKRGDQFVEVKVDIPKNLSVEDKKLIEQFARKTGMKY
jgi:molecular chaperone DnaJ